MLALNCDNKAELPAPLSTISNDPLFIRKYFSFSWIFRIVISLILKYFDFLFKVFYNLLCFYWLYISPDFFILLILMGYGVATILHLFCIMSSLSSLACTTINVLWCAGIKASHNIYEAVNSSNRRLLCRLQRDYWREHPAGSHHLQGHHRPGHGQAQHPKLRRDLLHHWWKQGQEVLYRRKPKGCCGAQKGSGLWEGRFVIQPDNFSSGI